MISNAQVDRTGRLLKEGAVSADCLHALEEFRSSFMEAYAFVEDALVNKMGLDVTGRPSKSTVAIVEKLRRETIRLTQMQDVAGCRVLVRGLFEQDNLVENALIMLGDVDIDDKRRVPTNGYRAVHLIVKKNGRCVEIQVRTAAQHAWATLSEKMADAFGQEIKYGGGPDWAKKFLEGLSSSTSRLEHTQHSKLFLSQRKAINGKSRELVREIKKQNNIERQCYREFRRLFNSIPEKAIV